MVDARNGSNLLYLPLDKLLQQAGAAPGAAARAGARRPPEAPNRRGGGRPLARRPARPRPREAAELRRS